VKGISGGVQVVALAQAGDVLGGRPLLDHLAAVARLDELDLGVAEHDVHRGGVELLPGVFAGRIR
jgi:hypothetical protein